VPTVDISADDLQSNQYYSFFLVNITDIMNNIHAARRIFMKNLILSMGWLLQCCTRYKSTQNPKLLYTCTYVPSATKITTQIKDVSSEITEVDYLGHNEEDQKDKLTNKCNITVPEHTVGLIRHTDAQNPKMVCVYTHVPLATEMTTQMEDISSKILEVDYSGHKEEGKQDKALNNSTTTNPECRVGLIRQNDGLNPKMCHFDPAHTGRPHHDSSVDDDRYVMSEGHLYTDNGSTYYDTYESVDHIGDFTPCCNHARSDIHTNR
jgi:hypothetical protein